MQGSSASTDKKTALVTGASSGIGMSIADMLVEEGYSVIGIGRSFTGEHPYETIECDLTDDAECDKTMRRIISENEIHILVNNAGVGFYGLHGELDTRDIRRMIRTNLEVPMVLADLCLPSIRRSQGWIFNITSVTAGKVNTHGAAYGATKAGLASFSESLFEEYRKHGVKVIDIRPDMTRTALYRNADFDCSDADGAYLLPSDVSEAVRDILKMRDGAVVRNITITPQYHRIERK